MDRFAVADNHERRDAEDDFRRIVDAFPLYMSIHAPDGRRLYASDALLDFLGFTQDEFRADDFRIRAIHPDDLQASNAVLAAAISRGEPTEVEVRVRGRNSEYRWMLILVRPLRDEHGRVTRWYCAGIDIEDRKQAADEVRRMVDAVPQHISLLAPDGQPLYTNKVAQDYFGLNSRTMP